MPAGPEFGGRGTLQNRRNPLVLTGEICEKPANQARAVGCVRSHVVIRLAYARTDASGCDPSSQTDPPSGFDHPGDGLDYNHRHCPLLRSYRQDSTAPRMDDAKLSPFAMVFVVVRVIVVIPAIDRMVLLGVETVVWSVISTACFLPSFVIAWQSFVASQRTVKVRAAA